MKSFMILILGSSGAIGRVLYNELKDSGVKVKSVSDFDDNAIKYDDIYENIEEEVDLIIDCSKKEFRYYIKLYEVYQHIPIVHFSTNRLNYKIKYDDYDYYKLDVLNVIKKFKDHKIIYGDLFRHNNEYLGYWSKLKGNFKIISSRDIHETSIEKIVYNLIHNDNNNINNDNFKTIKINSTIINTLLTLRINKLLGIFNYYIIK